MYVIQNKEGRYFKKFGQGTTVTASEAHKYTQEEVDNLKKTHAGMSGNLTFIPV